ncbi:hypothetical protein [Hafnia paralvei]|uniref:hypothetical protein n=1 Tax=Hafnia paralvei TaxID=546367 RepID=UPI0010346EE3|nr:hypothetical protein [Hafnia paralvei]TBL57329.1 hypothetical protein EYY97_18435 [Hafnia paralvei]
MSQRGGNVLGIAVKIKASAENIVDTVAHYPALTRDRFQAAIKDTVDRLPPLANVLLRGAHHG